MKDSTFVILAAMACITLIALVYDGELALIAVGMIGGILVPSPVQKAAPAEVKHVKKRSEPPA